jgi:hypothetical protein
MSHGHRYPPPRPASHTCRDWHRPSGIFLPGKPRRLLHMIGYSSHTYRWDNAAGERFWVKVTV